jgi:acyl dehydratase
MGGESGVIANLFRGYRSGAELVSGEMVLEREAIIAFAQSWDPLPIHLDDAAGQAAGFGGITASGTHLLAVKHRLLYDFGFERTVIASFGFDEVRFRAPAAR